VNTHCDRQLAINAKPHKFLAQRPHS